MYIVLNANELHLHLELFFCKKISEDIYMLHIIEHSLLDTLKLVPFLFLTYLAMEYMEHKTSVKTQNMIRKAGKLGPVFGGLLGIVPQCGFSAAASNLFTGRVITLGTLVAIYLSTSDEMLPILLSAKAPVSEIVVILLVKAAIGIVAGVVIDLLIKGKHDDHDHIHDLCEDENCHCEDGIFRSAVKHTLHITFFILLVTLVLNLVLHNGGEEVLANVLLNRPVLGPVLAGLVGLIPNCAASVVITQLYVSGAMNFGAAMAGLLCGSGVGLLVLFRVNHDKKENFKILGLVYGIGVVAGILLSFIGV